MRGVCAKCGLVLAALLGMTPAWADAVTPAPTQLVPGTEGLWLGHSRVGSERRLPILGTVRTRTDTWVLARFVQVGEVLEIEQVPCDMEIKPVAGVRVGMTQGAVRALPPARFLLDCQLEGGLLARPWDSGWEEEDLDGDGAPGVSVQVRSPLCGGSLAVASQTHSEAEASWSGRVLSGRQQVVVEQRILGATGACLRAVAQDSVDRLTGSFRYAPAPTGARCEDLPRSAWPVAD